MDSASSEKTKHQNTPADQPRMPNVGMGGTYDGDIPQMEPEEGGSSSHYPTDAASDTGREQKREEGRSPRMERDPDMDMGNHARDVQRDMISPSEQNQQPEMREPRRADHLSEDSEESDALPRDYGSEGTAGIP